MNEYLEIDRFNDSSKNWLQVDNTKSEIKKIAYAVDATSYVFDKAIKENVDMIITHHGLFWWFEQVLVWITFERIKKLIENNIALAAYHLPLDAHNEVWNNIWLVKEFIKTFGIENYTLESIIEYKGTNIWFWIRFDKKISIEDIKNIYFPKMKLIDEIYDFGNKKEISSIAFCSGGAGSEVGKVKDLDYDFYLTWEWAHHEKTLAKELKQSIAYAGHRETEKVWPELLAKHLNEKFGIEIVFIDEKY